MVNVSRFVNLVNMLINKLVNVSPNVHLINMLILKKVYVLPNVQQIIIADTLTGLCVT